MSGSFDKFPADFRAEIIVQEELKLQVKRASDLRKRIYNEYKKSKDKQRVVIPIPEDTYNDKFVTNLIKAELEAGPGFIVTFEESHRDASQYVIIRLPLKDAASLPNISTCTPKNAAETQNTITPFEKPGEEYGSNFR